MPVVFRHALRARVKLLLRGGAQARQPAAGIKRTVRIAEDGPGQVAHGVHVHLAVAELDGRSRAAVKVHGIHVLKIAHPFPLVHEPPGRIERQPVGRVLRKGSVIGFLGECDFGDTVPGFDSDARTVRRFHPEGLLRRVRGQRGARAQHQQRRKQHGRCAHLFHVFHGRYPLFNGRHAEAAGQGRQPAAARFEREQRHRIVPARRAAQTLQHARVAQQLHVPVGEEEHDPHQRIEPVHADAGGQQQLSRRVQRPDVLQLVQQHMIKRIARTVHAPGEQDHGAQDAVGERRANAAAHPHADRPAQRKAFQDRGGLRRVVRQRFPECPQAHDVGAQEMRGEQQHNGQPEDASPWQRGCALRRHVHDRGLRRDSRSGVRDLPHLRGLLRPMGKKGAQQRPRRIGPRQRKRHKQPQRRQIPQRDKHAPGQAAPARRAQQRRQRDHRAGGQAPLHKRHGRPLFTPSRRSCCAAAQAAPG